jgi:hypothetical protein
MPEGDGFFLARTAVEVANLLLLQLKRPIGLCHGLQDRRVLLQKLVVYLPEGCNELLAAAGATVVSDVQSEDVAREAIAVEVHGGRDFGASKTNVLGPIGDVVVSRVTDVAYRSKFAYRVFECGESHSVSGWHMNRWHEVGRRVQICRRRQ